jgi:hypothetical protein
VVSGLFQKTTTFTGLQFLKQRGARKQPLCEVLCVSWYLSSKFGFDERVGNTPPVARQYQLSLAVNNSTLGQVIGRKFDPNFVARDDSNEVFSHSASDMSHHFTAGFQLNTKSRIGQCLCDSTFDLEGLFFISQNQTSNQESLSRVKLFHLVTDCIDVRESGTDTVHIGMVKREPQVQL